MSFEADVNLNVDVNADVGGELEMGLNVGGGVDVNVGIGGGVSIGGEVGGSVHVGGGLKGEVNLETPKCHVDVEPVKIKAATPSLNMQPVNGNVEVAVDVDTGPNEVCGLPIPCISPAQALTVLVLNILWPGLGTMVLGCYANAQCCGWFLIGLAQDFLGYICVGWIWGIIMSLKVMALSKDYKGSEPVVAVSVGGTVGAGLSVGGSVGAGGAGVSVSVKAF